MLQKNHLFLFPQIYFGSLADFENELCSEEKEIVDLFDPWATVLETELTQQKQQKIGIFIHWSDALQSETNFRE